MRKVVDHMKKILLIAYAFPPQNIVGATRPFKFCKYLPHFGWKPFVIARKVRRGAPLDRDSVLSPDNPTKVFRCPDIEQTRWHERGWGVRLIRMMMNRFLLIPDQQLLWNIPLIFKTIQVVAKEDVDVLFCTTPPFSSLIGALVAARITCRPLFVDMRDLWTLNEYSNLIYRGRLRRFIEDRLERIVLTNAAQIIVNTDWARIQMAKKYKELAHKMFPIPNGFDPDDLRNIKPMDFKKFTIIHGGSFYGERNPVVFLKGFARWINSDGSLRDRVQIVFAGRSSRLYSELAEELGIDNMISYMDQVPKKVLYRYMKGADMLLLFLGYDSRSDYVIPAKIYEYIALEKQFLAFVPRNGQCERLIRRIGIGVSIGENDLTAVENALRESYRRYLEGDTVDRGGRGMEEFQYIRLTKTLVDRLDSSGA